jgi:hypothetical protein
MKKAGHVPASSMIGPDLNYYAPSRTEFKIVRNAAS